MGGQGPYKAAISVVCLPLRLEPSAGAHLLLRAGTPSSTTRKRLSKLTCCTSLTGIVCHGFASSAFCVLALSLSPFRSDFYDAPMRLILARFLRPEATFPSMELLIAAITADVENARTQLEGEGLEQLRQDPFLFGDEAPRL